MSQRTEIMLELVLDIKNNRKPKGSDAIAALEALLSQGSLKFLRESKVPDVQLRSVTWDKLLQPDKKVLKPSCAIVLTPANSQRHCWRVSDSRPACSSYSGTSRHVMPL